MKADRHRCADGCLPAIGCGRTPLPSRDPGPRAGGVPSSCPSPALPRGQLPPGATGLRKGHPCWEGSALQGPGEEVLALLQAEGSASGQRASASCPTVPGAPSPAPGHLELRVAQRGPRHPQGGWWHGAGGVTAMALWSFQPSAIHGERMAGVFAELWESPSRGADKGHALAASREGRRRNSELRLVLLGTRSACLARKKKKH